MAAVEMCEIEVWVVIDEDGDYACDVERDDAETRFDENIGFSNEKATRRVKITVKVPLPKPIEVAGSVVVSEDAGELKAV